MVLTGLLCVAFTVFAANKYQLIKDQNNKLAQLEKQISETVDANMKLRYEIYGDPAKTIESWRDMGLDAQLDYLRTLENGDIFVNCEPIEARIDEDAQTSAVAFGIDPQYQSSSFRKGAIVYLFDSGEQFVAKALESVDGELEVADEEDSEVVATAYSFLGAFRIKDSTPNQVNLESIGFASANELAAIADVRKSGRSFVACVDRLPIDSPADIAEFVAEEELSGLLTAFDADTSAFLSANTADVAALNDAFNADPAQMVANIEALFNDELRAPIAFQAMIERQWNVRNAGNVLMERNSLALKALNGVIASQVVSMGDAASEGFEDGYQAVQDSVALIDGFDEFLATAKARNTIPSYFEQIDLARVNLNKMEGYNALVQGLIAEAQENNELCQEEIDAFIAENARLASEIARVQFAVAEKIEQENSTLIDYDESNSYAGI